MYFYGYRQHQPHAFVNKLKLWIFGVVTVYSVICDRSMDGLKHFRHLERPHLSPLFSIIYNVIQWSLCELKRGL